MPDSPREAKHAADIPILDDRGSLLALYSEYNQISRFIVDKIWINARFFTTITSALLTVAIAALVKVALDSPAKVAAPKACILLSLLPIMVVVLSWIGIRNLRREYERFLGWVTVRAKIQERLGLAQEISSDLFPEDKHLLLDRYVHKQHASSESFIAAALKSRHSLYFYFRVLQYAYIAMALLLFVLMLSLACCL